MSKTITIQTEINASIEKVWDLYTWPHHITQWNNASPHWHTPRVRNDLRVGKKFVFRMESKDGAQGFDFEGVYTNVNENALIEYTIVDGRKVRVNFKEHSGKTKVNINFEPENENSIEMQRAGWQAILDNFKKYVESN